MWQLGLRRGTTAGALEEGGVPTLLRARSLCSSFALVRAALPSHRQGHSRGPSRSTSLLCRQLTLAAYFLELDHLEAPGRRLGHTTNPQRHR